MNNTPVENEINENIFAKEAVQSEVGIKLKKIREEKSLTSEYIIQELKFGHNFLDALESGNWENLPGEVYAIGFLKQYATLLQVDVTSEIESIRSKSFEMKTPIVYRDALISPQKKWSFIAIAVFITLIVVLNFSGSDEKNEPLHGDTNTNHGLIDLDNKKDEHLLTTEVLDSYTNAQPEVETISAIQENIQTDEEVLVRKKTYSFYAVSSDVWLQVLEVNENLQPNLLREALLKKGQSFSIIDTASKLVLTTGNPRALEVREDNEVLFSAGSLGENNKVLKLFPITP